MKLQLLVATKNKKKFLEVKDLLRGLPLDVTSLAERQQKIRIVENGKSFRENAVKKAVKGARLFKVLTLGEDSGLCVEALKGAPGIYSSRFSGRNKSDRQNNLKLLRLLKGLPLKRRKAHYVCAAALADEKRLIAVVEGRCSGVIGREEKGSSGFGYDPLFVVPRYKKTFAQLGERVKHRMSHRFRALRKIRPGIVTYLKESL